MPIINVLFRAFVLLTLLISIWACNDPNPQIPLIDKDVEILKDVMLLEAVLQDFTGVKKDSLAEENYQILYDRHGISEADLEDLRIRFSQDPSLWSRAADSIESRLKNGRTDFDALLNVELN